jgi:Holliday junction DNA helicase RuvA
MIGKLKGIIDALGDDWVLLDVNGVCYEVHCSPRTLGAMPLVGEAATLAIETYVREDQIKLFGFATDAERAWFKLLQSVQGVGAKVALAVLGTLSPQDLANAIALQDKVQVSRTPGVGLKVAQRIVLELKDKIPDLVLSGQPGAALSAVGTELAPEIPAAADAVSALTNLGYAQAQASAAVAAASRKAGEGSETAELIRLGLKELAQ